MKNKSHRYDIDGPRSRNRQKCTKYEIYSMMMGTGIKQHLRNIWSLIHEKVRRQ